MGEGKSVLTEKNRVADRYKNRGGGEERERECMPGFNHTLDGYPFPSLLLLPLFPPLVS